MEAAAPEVIGEESDRPGDWTIWCVETAAIEVVCETVRRLED